MNEVIFLLTLYIINLPPFYIFSSSLTINRLVETIWTILFLCIIINNIKNGVKLFNKEKGLFLTVSLIFLAGSFSIIYSINLKSFLTHYENLLFFFILSYIFIFIINKNNLDRFIKTFIYSLIIPIIIEFIFFFSPSFSKKFIISFLHQEASSLILFNISRGRIFIESFSFLIIPVSLFFLIKKHGVIKKLLIVFLILVVFSLSLISGFRVYFFLTIVNLVATILLFKKIIKKIIQYLILIIFLMGTVILLINTTPNLITSLDRFLFLLEEKNDSLTTITGRIKLWEIAFETGLSSPIFGIGLGNFFDYNYAEINKIKFSSLNQNNKKGIIQVYDDPHNIFFSIFSQMGLFGLISLIIGLIYFIKNDILIIKNKDKYLSKSLIISFWSLIAYSLINPINILRFFLFFTFLRTLIKKSSVLNKNSYLK